MNSFCFCHICKNINFYRKLEKGLIIKSTGSWYTVKLENGQTVNCTIKGKFRKEGIKSTNLVAVGDRVEVALLENEGVGIIQDYFERKNHIVRKATNLSKTSHIIAANVDQALLVTPKPPLCLSTVF